MSYRPEHELVEVGRNWRIYGLNSFDKYSGADQLVSKKTFYDSCS